MPRFVQTFAAMIAMCCAAAWAGYTPFDQLSPEAQQQILDDWSFQADNAFDAGKVANEIKWAKEAAERIGFFYSDLSLSGKIVPLSNNNWDLRSRHLYEAVHIDVKDIYVEVEESDGDSVDEEENKAYDQSVEGFVASSDDLEDLAESEENPKPEDASELLGIKKETLPEY